MVSVNPYDFVMKYPVALNVIQFGSEFEFREFSNTNNIRSKRNIRFTANFFRWIIYNLNRISSILSRELYNMSDPVRWMVLWWNTIFLIFFFWTANSNAMCGWLTRLQQHNDWTWTFHTVHHLMQGRLYILSSASLHLTLI